MNNTTKALLAFIRCSGMTDARRISAHTDIPLATVYRCLNIIKLNSLTGGNEDIPTGENIPTRGNENIPMGEKISGDPSRAHKLPEENIIPPIVPHNAASVFEDEAVRPPKAIALPLDEALEMWQQLAVEKGLPRVERMTKPRKQKLSARLREVGLEGWEKALAAIRSSKFHCGENDRGWRASFDFVTRSETEVAKLIERGTANGRARPTREQLEGMTQQELRRMMGAH